MRLATWCLGRRRAFGTGFECFEPRALADRQKYVFGSLLRRARQPFRFLIFRSSFFHGLRAMLLRRFCPFLVLLRGLELVHSLFVLFVSGFLHLLRLGQLDARHREGGRSLDRRRDSQVVAAWPPLSFYVGHSRYVKTELLARPGSDPKTSERNCAARRRTRKS